MTVFPMGEERGPHSKLFTSVLFSCEGALEVEVLGALESTFGQIEWCSERLPFGHTRYYEREMGPGLFRRVAFFEECIPSDKLIEVKHRSQSVEDLFRDPNGNRKCNVDPGILSLQNIVLATHKGYTHRIYLGGGVYADLTLIYERGSYKALSWTYPDYGSEEMIRLFNAARAAHLWRIRKEG